MVGNTSFSGWDARIGRKVAESIAIVRQRLAVRKAIVKDKQQCSALCDCFAIDK